MIENLLQLTYIYYFVVNQDMRTCQLQLHLRQERVQNRENSISVDRKVEQPMAARKKIALLIGQPEENYQNLFLQGFTKRAFESDYDVCIFAMYQKYQNSPPREQGESAIFSLINYERFDAIVLLADSIQTPGVIDELEEKLHREFHGPVISVDRDSKYFRVIKTDHYTPVKKLIEHLINVHGFTDIAYLTGKEWHPHSKERLKGFLDCMEEHHLPVGENRVFYGDFWYSSGVNVAQQLLRDPEHLPQAVACANDCMAIGLAGKLTEEGIRIPEDIAIVGYDALPEGKTCPEPITSAPIPSSECGIYTIDCLTASFEGRDMPEFQAEVELFIGSSCGCSKEAAVPRLKLREHWATEKSTGNYDSTANFMSEDLLLQADLNGLYNTVYSYVCQIRPYEEFYICMNHNWMTERHKTYTEQMQQVIKAGSDTKGSDRVDVNQYFDKSLMLPELWEEHDTPRAYYFSPLHYEEFCLGYSVISFGTNNRCYDNTYRKWIRRVMNGMEAFRKIYTLKEEISLLKAGQVRDSLTGFFTYDGFMEKSMFLLKKMKEECFVDLIAADIFGLEEIGEGYGVQGMNQVISDLAHIFESSVGTGLFCCLGSGEFLMAIFTDMEQDSIYKNLNDFLQEKIDHYNQESGQTYVLSLITGGIHGRVSSKEELESLINAVVSQKNGNKVKAMRHNQGKITAEEKKRAEIVRKILDKNKFIYHFQPIVEVATGKIYAYEALMRADVQPFISPLDILKYAEHFERLYDVEKATFFNVIGYMESHKDLFLGKKIFINSIPGNRLIGADAEFLKAKMNLHNSSIVVELTEQAELDDKALNSMRDEYEQLNIETAVDDYGTGYSNITNLLRYMPDYVKVDRMIITEIQNSPQKQHFFREIVKFAHDNDIKILAEGVETSEELETVIQLGADLIQGYYTAKPAPVPVAAIDSAICDEIALLKQQAEESVNGKIYYAGQESRASLVQLVAQNHSSIHVVKEKLTHRDFTIAGMPGLQCKMNIIIEDSYVGRIELQDVYLTGDKPAPAITIGENCDVTLALSGNNIFEQGGILVPESSSLTFQGDGNLAIHKIVPDGFAIGNGKDKKHGKLVFEQDGAIEINGNTMQGVAIGSDLGGEICITKGKYVIALNGEQGVGIGSFRGNGNYNIHHCEIEMNVSNSSNVGIGSMHGDVGISISNTSVKGYFGGKETFGIGSINGKAVNVTIMEAMVDLNIRSNCMCGIGCKDGVVCININEATVNVVGNGKEAIAYGNFADTGVVQAYYADIFTNMKTKHASDVGLKEFDLINCRSRFVLNGTEVEH